MPHDEFLKRRAHRSVRVVLSQRGRGVVVKAFHHPYPWRRLLDPLRARREASLLERLSRHGIRVPLPIARRGCEVWMEHVEDARPLDTLLRCAPAGGAPASGWPSLLRELGEGLARMHEIGLDHRDLHPGNVLVDGAGRPWWVDFQHARLRAPSSARRERDLVRAAAQAREHLSWRLRYRFLRAWWRGLPDELRGTDRLAVLARRIEAAARPKQRELVRRELDRWLRDSSRCRVGPERRLVQRRDRDGTEPSPERADHHRATHRIAGTPADVRRRWLNAARLLEHGLAVAQPAALYLTRPARAEFDLPAGLRPFDPGQERDRRAKAEFDARLADRGLGLAPRAMPELWVREDGKLLVGPPPELVELD